MFKQFFNADGGNDGGDGGTTTAESATTIVEPVVSPEDNQISKSSGPTEGLLASAGIEKPLDELPVEDAVLAPEPGQVASRPADVPEQFWDVSTGQLKGEVLAKSYNDLRKQFNQMSQDKGKVPEDYNAYLEDFKPPVRARAAGDQKEGDPLSKFGELESTDPAFLAMAKAAKHANLSEGQFKDLMPVLMEELHKNLPEPFNAEKEKAILGEGAENMIKTNREWIDTLIRNGVVNEDQYNLLLGFGGTALGVELTNALRLNSGEKPIPRNLNGGANTGRKTPDECAAMMADERYYQDGPIGDAYRLTVDAAFSQTHGTGNS